MRWKKVPCIKNQLWFPKRSSCRVTHTENSSLLWYYSFCNISSEIYICSNMKPFSCNFKHPAVAIFSYRCSKLSYYKQSQNLLWYPGIHPYSHAQPSQYSASAQKINAYFYFIGTHDTQASTETQNIFLQYSIIKVQFQLLLIYFTKKIQVMRSCTEKNERNFLTVKAHNSQWPRRNLFLSKLILLESIQGIWKRV